MSQGALLPGAVRGNQHNEMNSTTQQQIATQLVEEGRPTIRRGRGPARPPAPQPSELMPGNTIPYSRDEQPLYLPFPSPNQSRSAPRSDPSSADVRPRHTRELRIRPASACVGNIRPASTSPGQQWTAGHFCVP